MKKNIGTADMIVRIAAAVVIAVLLLTTVLSGTAGIIFGIIAAALLLTSVLGFCPLYAILKISTRKGTPAA